MKKKLWLVPLLAIFLIAAAITLHTVTAETPKQFGYVGVDACRMCHSGEHKGSQYEIWKNSLHAKAWHTLTTKGAKETAKQAGYKGNPAKIDFCLKCHVSGYKVKKSLLGPNFDMKDGVQCETCHGPGSEYIGTMANREKAIANGLKFYKDPKVLCLECHNEESPAYHGFDYEKLWKQIKHDIPK